MLDNVNDILNLDDLFFISRLLIFVVDGSGILQTFWNLTHLVLFLLIQLFVVFIPFYLFNFNKTDLFVFSSISNKRNQGSVELTKWVRIIIL